MNLKNMILPASSSLSILMNIFKHCFFIDNFSFSLMPSLYDGARWKGNLFPTLNIVKNTIFGANSTDTTIRYSRSWRLCFFADDFTIWQCTSLQNILLVSLLLRKIKQKSQTISQNMKTYTSSKQLQQIWLFFFIPHREALCVIEDDLTMYSTGKHVGFICCFKITHIQVNGEVEIFSLFLFFLSFNIFIFFQFESNKF